MDYIYNQKIMITFDYLFLMELNQRIMLDHLFGLIQNQVNQLSD